MKYLLKAIDAGDELNKEVGLFADGEDEVRAKRQKQKHRENAKRVDAFRSPWGINQGQLFGVAKYLTVWDELRRMVFAPKHEFLKRFWTLSRGSEKEGRIEAGAGQRGDAVEFLRALGGLDTCRARERKKPQYVLGLLVEEAVNDYGEAVKRTTGITLLLKERVQDVRSGLPVVQLRRATGGQRQLS